ncbi:hypothetical protein VaNZ11_010286, partial [Volvox africanus]
TTMRFLKPPMYGSCWKTMTTRVAVFSWRSVSRFSVFGRDASTAATSTDMFGRKRRRYSDGGNDSASEANNSLLAVTDQQREQLAAPDGAERRQRTSGFLRSVVAVRQVVADVQAVYVADVWHNGWSSVPAEVLKLDGLVVFNASGNDIETLAE